MTPLLTWTARPACGHSACSQNFIDTGETECIEATEQAPCPWCSGTGCGSCGGTGEVAVRLDGEPVDPDAGWSPPDEDDDGELWP